MIQGVIFDMDGLMFDTERMWATFWEPALAALGLPYKEGLAEAERGTAGETSRNIVRSFYGEDCDANAIIDSLHRVADKVFQKPVPKKPGLDELLAWLDEQHIPMAVASSSRMHIIQRTLDNWGLTHYFKTLASGQQVTHSKPDPEIFLLAAQQLGVEPARCLVLESPSSQLPDNDGINPRILFNNVVLPIPFVPTSAIFCPRSILKFNGFDNGSSYPVTRSCVSNNIFPGVRP